MVVAAAPFGRSLSLGLSVTGQTGMPALKPTFKAGSALVSSLLPYTWAGQSANASFFLSQFPEAHSNFEHFHSVNPQCTTARRCPLVANLLTEVVGSRTEVEQSLVEGLTRMDVMQTPEACQTLEASSMVETVRVFQIPSSEAATGPEVIPDVAIEKSTTANTAPVHTQDSWSQDSWPSFDVHSMPWASPAVTAQVSLMLNRLERRYKILFEENIRLRGKSGLTEALEREEKMRELNLRLGKEVQQARQERANTAAENSRLAEELRLAVVALNELRAHCEASQAARHSVLKEQQSQTETQQQTHADTQTELDAKGCGCSGSWGCEDHGRYTKALLLAHRQAAHSAVVSGAPGLSIESADVTWVSEVSGGLDDDGTRCSFFCDEWTLTTLPLENLPLGVSAVGAPPGLSCQARDPSRLRSRAPRKPRSRLSAHSAHGKRGKVQPKQFVCQVCQAA